MQDELEVPYPPRYVPAMQSLQVAALVAPTAAEYLPLSQDTQTREPGEAEYFPAPHSRQVVPEEAPYDPENLPAEHGEQIV